VPPSVSYVVTLYNKARFLPQVWAGLVGQRGGFQAQYVFVDDGSTDDTLAVLEKLTAGSPGVVVLRQANAGPAVALNAGLAEATGDFVKLVDGDDVLLPWCTEWMVSALQQTGAHAACALPGDQRSYLPGAAAEPGAEPPWPTPERLDLLPLSLKRAQTMPSLWLARREALRAVGGCDAGVFIQDYSLELRLGALGKVALLRASVAALPAEAPGRLSDNQAQTLHDMNRAALRFVAARPALAPALRRLAVERALGRAYLWAIRRGGWWLAPRLLALRALLALGLLPPGWAGVEVACAPFRTRHPVRVPQRREAG
jgi:GT2 family glycosyltransferase